VLSDDIRAKAEELHRNPVEIYNWIRNNVQWQPTWGAIQDASHTLSAQRGNAFDIASLMIALLRASGIPARYVHGTIDVPEEKFRNWAGGFEHIEAAMDFASAGGIPLGAVTSAGRVTKVRMEHIWVEAAINFYPSRGVRNRSADAWVSVDPSFKQVEVLAGLDAVQISGINQEQLSRSFLASGTVNEAEGWATGLKAAVLTEAQRQAQAAVQNYIQTNLPNATMGDVIGGRRIVAQNAPVLASGLPNKVVAIGAAYAAVPAGMQQKITFAFGKDIEGLPVNPKTFPWARLNNKQVTLSFRPATQADEDALRSLLPQGDITDVSQLPASIPAYLIRVVPELKVEGTVVMSGDSMTLGTELNFVFNAQFVSAGVRPFSYLLPAGSYVAVAVAGGSVSPCTVQAVQARLNVTKSGIESGNIPGGISRERIQGDIFQAGLLSYYAHYTAIGQLAGLRKGAYHALAAGLGSFGYEPNVDTFFGVPRSIKAGGAVMNMPIVNVTAADAVSSTVRRDYTLQLGALSSMLEHTVPEQLFNTSTNTTEAISAVKAISKAAAAGQRIYEITSANQATTLPMVHHDAATMSEIRAALASGKTVVTHTSAVGVLGWSGAGYILIDSDTGAAAWKIAGGQNGGFYTLTGLALGLVGGVAAVVAAPWVVTLVGIISVLITVINLLTLSNDLALAFNMGRLVGLISGVALAIILGQFVFITFPLTFYLGFLLLVVATLRLFIMEIITTLAFVPSDPQRRDRALFA
jgi:hypothetical protein